MALKSFVCGILILSFLSVLASAQCNNSPQLCDRSYGNITQLGAHNSAFVRDETTRFSTSGNQYYNSTVQLDAGVRLLTAQVHKTTGDSGETQWHLCHSSCTLLDAGRLRTWLAGIKSWMDSNPNDVVTLLLVNSDGASAADLGQEFTAASIDSYAYTPPTPNTPPTVWPTLQNLIANKTRLVTFIASAPAYSAQYPYLLDEFNYVFENSFENTSPSNFSCQPDRPTSLRGNPAEAVSSKRLFLMNHFLYSEQLFGIQVPDVDSLNVTNSVSAGLSSLGTRLQNCTTFYGRQPNFVLVDFFNVGPAVASVDRANGVTSSVGRKSLSQQAIVMSNSGYRMVEPKGLQVSMLVFGILLAALSL